MSDLNPEIISKAKNAFEIKCFKLIIEAYNQALIEKNIELDWNENDITAELHEHMRDSQSRKNWKISTNIEEKIIGSVPKQKWFGDKLYRIDIRLSTFKKGSEYEYFFEAKNLKQSDSKLGQRYIETGIDSFISEKYVNGSLLAYLLKGESDVAIQEINSFLIKSSRYTEILNIGKHKLCNYYYESNHPNIGILKHLVFDFTNI
ncbi:MAG: hypothetical protein MUC49_13950 [Raineya sp.]|jgi:hypothetical protein|nr:hypothetical protein [Raineya sp.]